MLGWGRPLGGLLFGYFKLVEIADAHRAYGLLDDLARVIFHRHARLVQHLEHVDPRLGIASGLERESAVNYEIINLALDILQVKVEVAVLHHISQARGAVAVRNADRAAVTKEVLHVGNHHTGHRTHRGGGNDAREYAETL